MDDEDFDRLFHTAQEWAANMDGTAQAPNSGFRHQISDGRFSLCGRENGPPSSRWKWGYWTGSFASVILGRAFLDAGGFGYEVVSDEADGDWAILTDYSDRIVSTQQ